MLEVNNINVFYGAVQALWDVSLNVEKGEIVGIIGSNGAGKTTTLKTISGLLHPKSGSISFLGKKIDRLPPYDIVKAGISHVPEGRRLFSNMTVLENLEMGAYTQEARKRKHDTLERVFQLFPILKERKNQLAGTLSGGEQQMLAIGRGLLSNPKLLMLDEISLGLAPKLIPIIFQLVKKINDDGITVLIVEQNIHQVLRLADRAYVFETGKVILEGKGKELLERNDIKEAYLGI